MNIRDLTLRKDDSDRAVPVSRGEDWSPLALQRDMNRFFDRFFSDFDLSPWSLNDENGGFNPLINVTENDDSLEISAELPGIEQEDIELSVTGDMLTIKGEKKSESEDEGQNYYRMERSYGSFCRQIPLPGNVVDPDSAEATYKNGVLTINLAKRPEAQEVSKRIAVKAG